jgi:hypothetical protein
MSKKLPKDDKGHTIIPGGKTFGNIVRPKSERKGRAADLKNRAAERIVLLMRKGIMGDKLSRPAKDIKAIERPAFKLQKEFAEAPKIVQLAHINNKLKDLREELCRLESSNNEGKVKLMKPIIEHEISDCEELIRELYREIKNERL